MGEWGDMWRVVWCHKFLIRVKIMWVISPLPAWQYLRRSGFYTDNRWVHSSFNILGSKSLSFFFGLHNVSSHCLDFKYLMRKMLSEMDLNASHKQRVKISQGVQFSFNKTIHLKCSLLFLFCVPFSHPTVPCLTTLSQVTPKFIKNWWWPRAQQVWPNVIKVIYFVE